MELRYQYSIYVFAILTSQNLRVLRVNYILQKKLEYTHT